MIDVLTKLDLRPENLGTFAGKWLCSPMSTWLASVSPIDGRHLGTVSVTTDDEYDATLRAASETFTKWRELPAPKRGEIVREIAVELRAKREELGKLVTLETGKILSEGIGEIQEAIDIADFAVGLSRQLYGSAMHSERAHHRMYEQWHPLGNIAVITAFNFPAAVWAWNAMIAAVCGNTVVWKPSELTPLTAVALTKICSSVAERHGFPGLFTLVTGDRAIGERMSRDTRFPLVSATGSCAMGRAVASAVAGRLGRSLLELGGNNAIILLPDANLELAKRAVLFGAVGTAGQRCTTTRRLLVHRSIRASFVEQLVKSYKAVRIGNPLENGVLMGPLISERAVEQYEKAVARIPGEGGKLLYGGERVKGMPSQLYVKPTIVLAHKGMALVREETFAPILYVIDIDSAEEGIEQNNAVSQGLSSAIFTKDLQSAERFLSAVGSDCGIANVNIGTSGAEIGGAFGGEKETGGGREAGSDSWKAYMRRQTNTINYGDALPLAQGVIFGE